MNKRLGAYARVIISAFALSIVFTLVNADPFTSSGADSTFDSTPSVPPKSRQSFDSSILSSISRKTANRIDGYSSIPPANRFSTGNIYTAFPTNKKANSIWFKSTDNLSFSGSIHDNGNKLSQFFNGLNMSAYNNFQAGNAINSGNNILPSNTTYIPGTGGGGYILGGSGGNIIFVGGGNSPGTGGGSYILSGSGGNIIFVGGGSSSGTGGGSLKLVGSSSFDLGGGIANSGISGNFIPAPVPEAGEWAMISMGLFIMFFVSRFRNHKFHPA